MTSGSADTASGAASQALPAPARQILFGRLTATDMAAAAVRRLRAAIGMGLLADGERLPREVDLAAQLGITSFSLREALRELRNQGLLVTRAGKHGGSFVTTPADAEEFERTELVRLSSSELRDLGDWRQMLASQSASLACLRATRFNHARLETYARQVGEAQTNQQARRAHGRFHVELASAAQSMRMTRAEFGVHEEIDWLFALALTTEVQRELSSRRLRSVADAVRAHDVQGARLAAERHSFELVGELTRLRLEIMASRRGHDDPVDTSLETEIGAFTSSVVEQLTSLAAQVAPLFRTQLTEPELRKAVALAVLQRITDLPPHVDEISVLADTGVVPGHRYWTEAWRRTELGPRQDSSHVMDPEREDFYDYETHEFIAEPRRIRQPWATGPYVDYGGADDYIITVSAPITLDAQFYGIAAVDFLVADLEHLLAPWLAAAPTVCVLVNADDRVVVSNSAGHRAGNIVADHCGVDRVVLPTFGWSLLVGTAAGAATDGAPAALGSGV